MILELSHHTCRTSFDLLFSFLITTSYIILYFSLTIFPIVLLVTNYKLQCKSKKPIDNLKNQKRNFMKNNVNSMNSV